MGCFDEGRAMEYHLQSTPDTYRCSVCGAGGVKLWRQAATFAPATFCARCASQHERVDISQMTVSGEVPSRFGLTDKIGNLVPAVPSGDTYWGYTSVPAEAVVWWRVLPNE